ncbi:unnamed protein product [Paramecium pentaurelia]|uniref:Transmembrane protein n=1 Tax=Paramecium pentaurelia TaxID=43138 RepID=A0A8S1YBB8_9CILI|nr:unnamed protein product [Paramecium pentaurelia]
MDFRKFQITILKLVDIFGTPYLHSIKFNQKIQKSIIGGITSIFVLVISLAYFIYVFNQWITFQILPKTNNSMKVEQYSEIHLQDENPIIQLSYGKYSEQKLDPFDTQNNILMPIGIYFIDGKPQKPFSLLNNKQKSDVYPNKLLPSLNTLTLVQNGNANQDYQKTTELVIMITKCHQEYLNDGGKCATDQQMEEFFATSVTYLDFWINLKQYNFQTQQFEVVRKQYYFWFESKSAQLTQIMIKKAYLHVDKGILFNSYSDYNYIQDTQIMMSTTTTKLWAPLISGETYLSLIFRLDPVSIDIQLVYQKLGEVLAMVGSIVNLLMIVKYGAQFYNESLLENKLTDKIIKYYYSDFEELKASQDTQTKLYYNQLKKQAKKKLIFHNILYELSRIQLFLFNQYGRTQIENSHQLKFRFQDFKVDFEGEVFTAKQQQTQLNLIAHESTSNFMLISIPEKDRTKNQRDDKVHPEIRSSMEQQSFRIEK